MVYNELVGNTAMINVETARRITERHEYYEDSLNCIICPLRQEEKQVRIIQKLVRCGQELEKLRRAYEAISRLRVLREEGKKTKTAQFARK